MHRFLLYTLVIALLYLAWDVRRGEVLAAGQPSSSQGSATLLAGAPEDTFDPSAPGFVLSSASLDPDLQARLEARVHAEADVWAQFEADGAAGPAPERVLAAAEAWMEANFPEGGATAKDSNPEEPGIEAPAELAVSSPGAAATTESGRGAEFGDQHGERKPMFVASLARIESLSGELPAWCGLLDLALQPAGAASARAADGSEDGWMWGDTAWISDDRGRLLARVEALDGLGFELDSSWPWIARQRRLFWTESGASGLPARQYRLILEGNGFVPSWSGRLVLIHTHYNHAANR